MKNRFVHTPPTHTHIHMDNHNDDDEQESKNKSIGPKMNNYNKWILN